MKITSRELRQMIRETLMMEMRGRHSGRIMYGGPPPEFHPEEMADADDDSFFGGPPELNPEEMEDMFGDPEIDIMGYETGPDDVPWGAADTALAIGHKHRAGGSRMFRRS